MLPSQAHDMAAAISRTIVSCLQQQQQQSNQTSQPRGSSATASCSISHAAPAASVVSSQPNTTTALHQRPQGAGRPKKAITEDAIENLQRMKFTKSEITRSLGISRSSLYNRMRQFQLPIADRYSEIRPQELDSIVRDIKTAHPDAGEVLVQGHLRSRGIYVRRQHMRDSIHRVDPRGGGSRLRPCIQHRVYSVPCPNYLWHVDGNHKLIRWRIVVHGAIDGFSRLVTFLKASDNNLASTVLELFDDATATYGIPLRIRTDHGGENVKMWERMYEHRGAGRRPVIVGSSVHNERIERFNRDINKSCERQYKPIFYELESRNLLDPENDSDIFCLHYVFMPRINKTIEEFRQAHNHHSISTEGNKSPVQLFYANQHLISQYQGQSSDDPYNGCSPDILLQRNLPHVAVPTTNCPLTQEQLENLTSIINPLSGSGLSTYQDVVAFVGRCLTN